MNFKSPFKGCKRIFFKKEVSPYKVAPLCPPFFCPERNPSVYFVVWFVKQTVTIHNTGCEFYGRWSGKQWDKIRILFG